MDINVRYLLTLVQTRHKFIHNILHSSVRPRRGGNVQVTSTAAKHACAWCMVHAAHDCTSYYTNFNHTSTYRIPKIDNRLCFVNHCIADGAVFVRLQVLDNTNLADYEDNNIVII